MALDGIMMRALCNELREALVGGRVEKVNQPERDEIVLNIHNKTGFRLLMSADPSHARVHITSSAKENPAVAPNFCMLLRKHLVASRITDVSQPGLERVLIIRFECRTELYDTVYKQLIIEVMGRYSNIIFTDGNGIIADAVKPVDFTTSSKRQILPGLRYELPPSQDKILLTRGFSPDFSSEKRGDKYLTETFLGFSPLLSRELVFRATGETDTPMNGFSQQEREKLINLLEGLYDASENGSRTPSLIFDGDKPLEYYCLPITQYGEGKDSHPETLSAAMDRFFAEKSAQEHSRRLGSDTHKLLTTHKERLCRKLEAQRAELADCEKSNIYRLYGDMIIAEMYRIGKGMDSAVLTDYTADPPEQKTVPLDARLTPSANAQRYYKMYKKAQTAIKILNKQIPEGEKELVYLDSVFDELSRAGTADDLRQIRAELAASGYVKAPAAAKGRKAPKKERFVPFTVVSPDGFTVMIGKNNVQNDEITTSIADKHDIWFHVKDYPGSHVVVVTDGRKPPDSTLDFAAHLAADNSGADSGAKVAVDYTEIRNVRKPGGSRPGMVIYDNYRTAYVVGKKNQF